MKSAVERIMLLFSGFEKAHGTHGVPVLDENGVKWGIKKTARTLREPVTLGMWEEHLKGTRPLGVIPIREDSTCVWGSIDIDDYEIDVLDVVKRVEAAKLPLVPGRSKSGGLHLFLFCAEPTEAELVQGALRDIAASLGFAGSEIFPKQVRVNVEQGDQGNWMVMPYFGGNYGGKLKFQYGLKKTGAEMTLEEFLTIAEKRRVTVEELTKLRSPSIRKTAKSSKKPSGGKAPFSNGPPCLEHMAEGGFPEGGRNNALFHIGVFLKRAHPDEWQKRLEQDNQKFMRPPLNADEVKSVVRSLEKKDYEYKCNDQPMASHCNSVICRGRKFGVGNGGAYPTIEALAKLDTEPPLWFVDVPGAHITMKTEDLTNYRRFHNLCVAHASVVFRLIPDAIWMSILSDAMQNVRTISAPPEVGRGGMFRELLTEFLTNRTRGERREDLLRGVPWESEEESRFYFKLEGFQRFLSREGVKSFERPEIATRIREVFEGDSTRLDVKGHRNLYMWYVPTENVERAPELDVPDEKQENL